MFKTTRFMAIGMVAILLSLLAVPLTLAQEDLDTTLARAAARGFLTSLTRPDLQSVQSFYMLETGDFQDTLMALDELSITGYEVVTSTWVGGTIYQTEVLLKPSQRTLIIDTGRHENRWKVEGLTLDPLPSVELPANTGTILTTTHTAELAPIDNGLTGLIAFQLHSGSEIYVINADGTNLRYVTHGIDPELSPDGTQIAFTRWEPNYTLYTINVDGTNERAWASGWRKMKSPSWSADGTHLVFSYQNGGQLAEEFVSYNPADYISRGKNPPEIPRPVYDLEFDSQTGIISYKIPPDAYWHLQQVDLTTGQYADTSTGNPYSYGSSFHPTDPNILIFRGDRGLGLYNVSEHQSTSISSDVGDKAAVISPDGQQVALTHWYDNWDIDLLNIDGSGRQRLTQTPPDIRANRQVLRQEIYINEEGYRTIRTTQGGDQPNFNWHWQNAAPAWSPDSQHILFMTDRTGEWEIWIMDRDGSNQRPMFINGALDHLTFQYDGVDERMLSWRSVE